MCVLTLISVSRPALCLLTTLLSAAFMVALFVHIPTYAKDIADKRPVPEDQPMFVLPSGFILVHIAAIVIVAVSYNTHDPSPPCDELPEGAPPPAAVAWPPVADSVLSSLWARVAVAAARLEAQSSAAAAHSTFAAHALFTGNSFIVLCTIALAAPHSAAALPTYARALGMATIGVSIVYQLAVFVPTACTKPPAVLLAFLLCFVHDVCGVVGPLSAAGSCEGSGCVSLAGYGYTYAVSVPNAAVLLSFGLMALVIAVALAIGSVCDVIAEESSGCAAQASLLVLMMMAVLLCFFFPLVFSLVPALTLSVPCLGLGAMVAVGLGPRCPAAAAEHALLHLYCDEVTAQWREASSAAVLPGARVEAVPLPALCTSPVLCHGPTAAELHVVRWQAAQHGLTFAPGARGRKICVETDQQKFEVAMAEVAAVLTPQPQAAALPYAHNSPMAFLAAHLAVTEEAAAVELRPPLRIYLASANDNPLSITSISSSASDADPPFSVAAPKSEVDDSICHVDLATEAFDRAVEGWWPWLLRFAWRRRSFAPRPSHVVPHSFEWLLWRSGSVTFTKAMQSFGWAAIAALVVTRPVLFVAPFLEPAFNTNPPTAVYVCLAVRVACWVGIALLAPGLYRAVCRMASFAVASGGPTGRAPATVDTVRGAVVRAGRCIAAAYDLSAPMALAFSVPHCVVSRVVISRAVAPFLPPDALA